MKSFIQNNNDAVKTVFNDFVAVLLLFLIGSLIAHIFEKYIGFTTFYGSTDYFAYAQYLIGNTDVDLSKNTSQTRTFLYPFALWVLGGKSLDIEGIASGQLLIGMYVPIILFVIFRISGRSLVWSIITAFSILVSLVLFISSRTVLNEQLYTAFWVLFSGLLYGVIKTKKWSWIILSIICLWLTTVTRPTPLLLIIPFMFLVLYIKRDRITPKLIGTLVAVTFVFIASCIHLNKRMIPDYTSGFGIFGLMNIVVYSGENIDWAIQKSDGKHTSKLIELVEVQPVEDTLKLLAAVKAKALSEADRLKLEDGEKEYEKHMLQRISVLGDIGIFTAPTLQTYWSLKWLLINSLGIQEANHLAINVMKEQAILKPMMIMKYWVVNAYWYMAGKGKHYRYLQRDGESPYLRKNGFNVEYTNKTTVERFKYWFNPNHQKDLRKTFKFDNTSIRSDINVYFTKIATTFSQLNFILSILTVIYTLVCIIRKTALNNIILMILSCQAVVVYHAAVIGFVHPPLGRYVYPVLPLMIVSIVLVVEFISGQIYLKIGKNSGA